MEIQVLGFWGTYPGPGEATTGFLLQADGKKILLDCGSGVLAQLFKVCSIEDLDAVVITHHHHDHVADLGVLTYALLLSRLTQQRTRALPVYLPQVDSEAVRGLVQEPLAEVHYLIENSEIRLGNLMVRFAKTTHPVFCLAPRFEADGKVFVFSADSAWDENLLGLAQDADVFLCEASMYKGMEESAAGAGHLTSAQAGQMAARARVKRLLLTHYPHYGERELLAEEAAQAFGKPVEQLETLQVLRI